MKFTSNLNKLVFAFFITLTLSVSADLTDQEKEPYLKAGITSSVQIERLIEKGVTAEQARPFYEKAPMINPYIIHAFIAHGITAETALTFDPRVADNPYYIKDILDAGITPETANCFINEGITSIDSITSLTNAGISAKTARKYFDENIESVYKISNLKTYQISPEVAGAAKRAGIRITTPYDLTGMQTALQQGLAIDDIQKYKGLASSADKLKELYTSKIPVTFLQQAMDKGVSVDDGVSLFFRGIDLDTYQSLTSDQKTCTTYPGSQLKFEYLDNLIGYQSEREPVPLPKALFSTLNSIFTHDYMYHFSTDDQLEILRFVENKVKEVESPTIHSLLYLTADIVSERIKYADVDDGELEQTFPKNCSIAEYWRRGIGDCDKYTSLGMVVFAQLKQLFPDVLKNVYLTKKLFTKVSGHAWNTVVIAEKDQLVITYIDITKYDDEERENACENEALLDIEDLLTSDETDGGPFEDKNGELGALNIKNFDYHYFLTGYQKQFCQQ
ncbi:hypothetical protein [Endozoicomonas montiporae]|uniref:Transglutaminase-like domain-containing protein n=1 Tax=Endozoicomonas montiporae CL-33 TaxID=570277 RepID=A0A142BHI6_9GAMM|nr:hypothetical protein [Endozoicomonas montiporae]AMO58212.1 hypothetical protein EZMO1_4294 [Endozoicomonas montiporae CL-33]